MSGVVIEVLNALARSAVSDVLDMDENVGDATVVLLSVIKPIVVLVMLLIM